MAGSSHVKPEQFFNLIWGYYDRYLSLKSGNADGGSVTLSDDATPADTVRVITSVALYTTSVGGTTRAYIAIFDGSSAYLLSQKASMAQYESVDYHGQAVLKEGDYIRGVAAGVTSGHAVYMAVCGYDMKLSQ